MNIKDLIEVKGKWEAQVLEVTIAFYKKDVANTYPHNDDPWSLPLDVTDERSKESS